MTKRKTQVDSARGMKMIELKIRFWTNNIAPITGGLLPKHAWTSGVVRMDRNPPHGLPSASPVPFNSLLELPAAIEKVLLKQGVQLHASRKMKKYLTQKPDSKKS